MARSSNVNKVIIIGNVGRDPELRRTSKGNVVTTLSVATSRDVKRGETWEQSTEWHRAVVWGKTAESCAQHLKKGNRVYIEGAIEMRAWKDKEGKDHQNTEIRVENIKFLGKNTPNSSAPAENF